MRAQVGVASNIADTDFGVRPPHCRPAHPECSANATTPFFVPMSLHKRAVPGSTEAGLKDLLDYYRKTVKVHRAVSDFCQSDQHHQLFWQCLKHDLRIIQSRSPDLNHNEINIYQKAFVALMTNDEDHIAGVELYAEELLGLKFLRAAEKDGALRQAVETRRLVTESTLHGHMCFP